MTLSKSTIAILATGIAAFATQQVQAAQINGDFIFGGKATIDTPSLATATTIVTSSNVSLVDTSDDFSSATTLSFSTPWTFNPGNAKPALFTLSGGGNTFIFNLTSATYALTPGFLNIRGIGTVDDVGAAFDETSGLLSVTLAAIPNKPGQYSFGGTFNSPANLPDGGSTVAFLGLGLAGMEGMRRKLAARKA